MLQTKFEHFPRKLSIWYTFRGDLYDYDALDSDFFILCKNYVNKGNDVSLTTRQLNKKYVQFYLADYILLD